MPKDRLRVVAATPIPDELVATGSWPPSRASTSSSTRPCCRRCGTRATTPALPASPAPPEQQARFEQLVDSAQVLYGIPGERPACCAARSRRTPGSSGCS